MKKIDLGQTIQVIANVGVIAGIIFLAFELRQNTIASRSAAFQSLGVATAETWFSFSDSREVSDILWEIEKGGVEAFRNLSSSDQRLAINILIGWFRLFETAYLQVQQGLLEPDALESLGYRGLLDSPLLEATWDEVKQYVTPSFAEYVDSVRSR
jgi:hypothetical protein